MPGDLSSRFGIWHGVPPKVQLSTFNLCLLLGFHGRTFRGREPVARGLDRISEFVFWEPFLFRTI